MTKINYSKILIECVFKMYIWLKLMTSQLYRKNVLKKKMY